MMITIERNMLNGVEIPKMKKGGLNIYNEQQIKAAGGIDGLCTYLEYEKPQTWATMDLTDDEWKLIDQLLLND